MKIKKIINNAKNFTLFIILTSILFNSSGIKAYENLQYALPCVPDYKVNYNINTNKYYLISQKTSSITSNTSNSKTVKDMTYYCNTSLIESLKINSAIKQKAKDLIKGYTTDIWKAYKIYLFVSEYIKYDYARANIIFNRGNMCNWKAGAQYAYDTKKGVCFEYATLFAAMAKEIGIKVRLIYGDQHIWNEIYDSQSKKWVSVDCTWKLFNFDVKKYHKEYNIHAELEGGYNPMKVAVDIGHNVQFDGGAVKYLNENTCNKEVGELVIKYLKDLGNTVTSCLPSYESVKSLNDSLNKRCEIANNNGCDFFISIHFNAGGGSGTETWHYNESTFEIGKRITQNISKSLNVIDRGQKINTTFAVLNGTNMPAILIECMFVDSLNDKEKYNADKIARAIVEGFTNQKIENITVSTNKSLIRLQVGAFLNEDNADRELEKLKALGINAYKVKERQ